MGEEMEARRREERISERFFAGIFVGSPLLHGLYVIILENDENKWRENWLLEGKKKT